MRKVLFLTILGLSSCGILPLFTVIQKNRVASSASSDTSVSLENFAEFYHTHSQGPVASSQKSKALWLNRTTHKINLVFYDLMRNILLTRTPINASLHGDTTLPVKYLTEIEWEAIKTQTCDRQYHSGGIWILPLDPFYFNGNVAHFHIFGAFRIWNTLMQVQERSIKYCCPPEEQIILTLSRLRAILSPIQVELVHSSERILCLKDAIVTPLQRPLKNIHWGARSNPIALSEEDIKESKLLRSYAEYLNTRLLNDIKISRKSRAKPKLVLVKRTGRRRLLNIQRMVSWAQSRSLETTTLNFSNGSWKDHARILSNADILLSCHGADLTNMLFLLKGSLVIEIFPYKMAINQGFRTMALYLGLRYIQYQESDWNQAVPYEGAGCRRVFSNWTSLKEIPWPSQSRGKDLDRCMNYLHTNLTKETFMNLVEQALILLKH
eukprot:jgi/Galph1/172/GphlegSOOS_G4995.1